MCTWLATAAFSFRRMAMKLSAAVAVLTLSTGAAFAQPEGEAGGEAALKPMIALISNAIYDATGVRMRRAPFRDARVLAALRAARV